MQNRSISPILVAMGMCTMAGFGYAVANPGPPAKEKKVHDVIQARRFDVINSDGYRVASLGSGSHDDKGRAILDLRHPTADTRVTLQIQDDSTPLVSIQGPDGNVNASLYVGKDGWVMIDVAGASRKEPHQGGLKFGFPKHGVPTLELSDNKKNVRMRIDIDPDKGPIMTFIGEEEQRRITARGDDKTELPQSGKKK